MNEKEARNLAIYLLNEVEELLDEHNIEVPDADREGNKEEASLYGTTYYNLEDTFVRLIMTKKLPKVYE